MVHEIGVGRSRTETDTMAQPSNTASKKAMEPSSDAAGVSTGLTPSVKRRLYPRIQKHPGGDTLLQIGEKFKDRWLVKGLIGSGGYGQIYFAVEQTTGESHAIKVEPTRRKGKTVRRIILEQRVLLLLQGGRAHFPLMHGSGVERGMNYIVMDLLSVNIGDLRKQSPVKRLSVSTTARIMQQAIGALRELHHVGYLHRDVKPANMCFGVTEMRKRRLFLVDFGLVRRFKASDGTTLPKRARAGFRGTLRYVSPRVHEREEQGPADDLIALLYCMIELVRCELPWKNFTHQKEIKEAKEELKTDDLQKVSEGIGDPMRDYGRTVMAMSADDEPNYVGLQETMKELAAGKLLTDPYDWENEFADVLAETELNKILGLCL